MIIKILHLMDKPISSNNTGSSHIRARNRVSFPKVWTFDSQEMLGFGLGLDPFFGEGSWLHLWKDDESLASRLSELGNR